MVRAFLPSEAEPELSAKGRRGEAWTVRGGLSPIDTDRGSADQITLRIGKRIVDQGWGQDD
jgi:hypothetical protein